MALAAGLTLPQNSNEAQPQTFSADSSAAGTPPPGPVKPTVKPTQQVLRGGAEVHLQDKNGAAPSHRMIQGGGTALP